MIGKYWSTGIKIAFTGNKWIAICQFYDDGFCEDDSTEGTIFLRYRVEDLAKGIRTLIDDVLKLGIVFYSNPALYIMEEYRGDEMPLPSTWQDVIKPIAQEIGFAIRKE